LAVQVNEWATCPLTESGFVRISMTTAYQATFADARKSLATLRALPGHRFLSDGVEAASQPVLSSYKDTTDAHLVTLAKRHGMKLATLDTTLLAKPWAAGVAENPCRNQQNPDRRRVAQSLLLKHRVRQSFLREHRVAQSAFTRQFLFDNIRHLASVVRHPMSRQLPFSSREPKLTSP
jgi:predicted nucleic acid-binding protein